MDTRFSDASPVTAFFGSPRLAAACLEELLQSYAVGMVVTQPDKSSGRGRALSPTPVARVAEGARIPLYKPAVLRADFADTLAAHGVQLVVVVAYGKLLPGAVLAHPPRGAVNLHGSLLPKYRGPSPIQAALLHGEPKTGVTVQLMKERMDAGDILAAKEVEVPSGWTAEDLTAWMERTSPAFLRETLDAYLSGGIAPAPQDETLVTFCSLLRKGEGEVDWSGDAESIARRIRAFNVWPVCRSSIDGKVVRLFDARALPDPESLRGGGLRGTGEAPGGRGPAPNGEGGAGEPGLVVSVGREEGIVVRAGRGYVGLLELQLENRKRVGHLDFANGYRNLPGRLFSSSKQTG